MKRDMSQKSRVLLIAHTASLGGAELALLRLVQNLDTDRFEPVVLLFSEGPAGDLLRKFGVEVHCLPLAPEVNQASRTVVRWRGLFRGKEILLIIRHVFRVMWFIRKQRVDLVHTNSLKAAVIGGLAAVLARKPLIWYVHDRIADDYLPRFAIKGLHLLALTLPTYVVGNSVSTLRTFLPRLPLRYGVVYPGVETERFAPPDDAWNSACGENEREILVGIVGRLSPTKGQDVFIRAAALVAARHPKVKFLIVGSAMFNDGPWETEIRRMANEHPDVQIQFTGFCHDIPRTMAGLDVVVHASTVPEPFGQVVAEAMACGRPVIATEAGGVPEVLRNGICGWLVPRGDAEKLADRIVWFLDNPHEAIAMGRRGRARVERDFTVEKMARDMETIYERSLAAGVPRLSSRFVHILCGWTITAENVLSITTT